MASVAKRAASKVLALLQAPAGLNDNLAALTETENIVLPQVAARQFFTENVSPEVVERTAGARYPTVHVYCDKFANILREKFRTFSGKAFLVIEVRVTQDRLEGLEKTLQIYVDAVTRVLDQNRGDWGNGMFYTGGYEAAFAAVKHGGRNFSQTGKVTFEVEVSID